MDSVSYKGTIFACYLGSFTQAAVINLTPILFVPLREAYGLSYTQFGTLVLANFTAQVLADVLFSKAVDVYGFRPFALLAQALCAVGFWLFAAAPVLFPNNVFAGFFLATVLFSAAGGLLELLLSPIVDQLPGREKEKAMAFLHSFYCWGQIAVTAVTSLVLFAGGAWQWIICGWSLLPLMGFALFCHVPLCRKSPDATLPIRALLRIGSFWYALGCIACGAAVEASLAQYISVFLDRGLAVPKIAGDLIGVCGFALMMGLGRTVLGVSAKRFGLGRLMLVCCGGAVLCCAAAALSPLTAITVAACVAAGLFVSALWPGTLLCASQRIPAAGASMFALLAAGGDLGASLGAGLTGRMVDLWMGFSLTETSALRAALGGAALFPVLAAGFAWMLRNNRTQRSGIYDRA